MSSELVWIHRFNANELGLSEDGTGRGAFCLVPTIARKIISPNDNLDITINVTFIDLKVTVLATYKDGYPNDPNKKETRLYIPNLSAHIGLEQDKPINPSKIACFYRKNGQIYVLLDSKDSALDKLLIEFPYRGKPNNLVTTFVIDESDANKSDIEKGRNILLYGVAGVGKSYNINKITGEDETYIERIVFHPDYLNTDFVGQILPKVNDDNGKIDYKFEAGSFTKILKKAINDPSHHYYLVIEEINRGNAPAIFGEVFQLLDRKDEGSSNYRISHDLMAKEIFNDPDKTIFIPNNLTILATMNTADQNVFTLDTAFQRRWTMRMIENNINNCDYRNDPILDTGITWKNFNTVINNHILKVNQNTLSSEDKRLGAFFIRQDELTFPEEVMDGIPFAEKVIKYLWDDVFKFNKSGLFESNLKSLDEVLGKFKSKQGLNRFDIFIQVVRDELKPILQPQINVQAQPNSVDDGSDVD